jgi:hypothetical protein
MDNLPNDKNQAGDNTQNVTNDNPPVTLPETPPVPTVEKPPEEKPETPPPKPQIETPPPSPTEEGPKSEEQPKEQSIEVGSLDKEPAFTSYTQTSAGDDSGTKNKKGKKLKTIASVLGLLLIITALPLTVILVKQRQEIRKEAAGTKLSGSVSFCGITVKPISHNEQNGVYTFNYSISGNGQTVEVHEYGCVCSEGNRETCGTSSGSCSTNKFTKTAPFNGTITVRQPAGDCGTFQADVFVLSVNGDKNCHNN